MTLIQIADPKEHTLLECWPRQHVCYLEDLTDPVDLRMDPSRFKPGPLPKGVGTATHEDLGPSVFANLPVHMYRDTTTLKPGVHGNDAPMSYVREYRFSPDLGFNLTSTVENPHFGKQLFTVADITMAEPDAHFFGPPDGYKVVDRRKSAMNAGAQP